MMPQPSRFAANTTTSQVTGRRHNPHLQETSETKDPWRNTATKKDILYRDAVLGEAASHLLVDRARAGLDTGRPFCGHLCGLSSTA